MVEDFKNAHRRHWDDAELLRGEQRLANADQLYGISAECGLKAIMSRIGLRAIPKRHVDQLWPEFETHLHGRVESSEYGLAGSPFGDWRIDDRYAHQDGFDGARVASHRRGAKRVNALVKQAEKGLGL